MKKKIKILLSTIAQDKAYLQLALLYLKTSALSDGYLQENVAIEIEEFNFIDTDDFILYKIEKYNPQIIGFSCYIWNIQRILSISAKLKQIHKNIKIILGGPHVSPIAQDILKKNNQIDFIVRDEGEITFTELIKSLIASPKNFNQVSGVTYRDNGKVIDNIDRKTIADLDSIPSPYLPNLKDIENREVGLETQRGCVFKCHFCYYNKSFQKIRFFSLERVKENLSFLLKQKVKRIYLMDPVFNLDIKRAKEICKFIIENNKNNIEFHTEIKAELVDEELARLFYEAKIKYLEIGLQSTNERVLDSVNRKLNFEKFSYGLELLNKYNLDTEVQLIFGLPQDTLHSFMKSLEQVLALKPKLFSSFRLLVLPGTEIWHKAEKWGIVYENEPYHRILKSNLVSFSDVVRFEKINYNLHLFKQLRIIKCLCKDIDIKLLALVELWLDYVDDDKILLNFRYTNALKEKLHSFLSDLCQKHKDKINLDFYTALLNKEIELPVK